jgi:dTDP-glucose 4,6-dehydratase
MAGSFRRAVVTGGAGFLGRQVCRCLLDQGTSVVCVDNLLTGGYPDIPVPQGGTDLEFRPWGVAEPFDVAGEVDLVMHLASLGSPVDWARYPVESPDCGSVGTRNALELAAHKNARFVLASAPEAPGNLVVSPAGPRSARAEAKRYAEALTAAYRREGLANTAIARVFGSYGPGMRPEDGRMVSAFARQALLGEPVTVSGDGTQTRSLCHADDTARGLLLLAASDLGGPVNIGNPDGATVGEIAARIISLAGSSSPVRYIPRLVGGPVTRTPDITFARIALGFEPRVPWREGLSETIDWFRRLVAMPSAAPPRQAEVVVS